MSIVKKMLNFISKIIFWFSIKNAKYAPVEILEPVKVAPIKKKRPISRKRPIVKKKKA